MSNDSDTWDGKGRLDWGSLSELEFYRRLRNHRADNPQQKGDYYRAALETHDRHGWRTLVIEVYQDSFKVPDGERDGDDLSPFGELFAIEAGNRVRLKDGERVDRFLHFYHQFELADYADMTFAEFCQRHPNWHSRVEIIPAPPIDRKAVIEFLGKLSPEDRESVIEEAELIATPGTPKPQHIEKVQKVLRSEDCPEKARAIFRAAKINDQDGYAVKRLLEQRGEWPQ